MKNKKAAFVDTSGWVAFLHKKDLWHREVKAVIEAYIRSEHVLVTSNFILDETITMLRKRIPLDTLIKFVENLARSSYCNFVEVDRELWNLAWGIFKQYRDKQFSFTDCTSFAIMREMGIDEAISLDRHFDQMGFMRIF
ncbi:MAG: PIN domain-containing protein [candidate division KSB1 bacterium]|nr:PIN domain-containing protein [candidate division KSB1 bacterium]